MANPQSSANTSSNEAEVQSSFPQPPIKYIEKYTNDAMMHNTAPKPPLPVTDTYMMFGLPCQQDDLIIRPLELQGLKRLHPQVYDRRQELKKMTVSILCNFLDLLDILVNATGSQARDEKIEELNLLFIHIHHLINEFRPHQARETLKVMMEMQQAQMLDVGERLWKHIEKAGKILAKCTAQLSAMQARASGMEEAGDLMQMQELPESNVGVGANTAAGVGDTAVAKMEVDESDMIKEIYEKDKILAGLLEEIED